MKKLSFLVGALALSTAVFAQKPASGEGKMSLEGQLKLSGDPVNLGSTLDFTSPVIRFRYFVQENIAARVSLGINSTTTTDNFTENADGTGATGSYEMKTGSWNFNIGAEYHFAGTEKLSPYAGLDIMLGGGSATADGTNSDGAGYIADYSETSEAKMSGFGVNLVGGTDYYFAQNFYLGLELGWGWMSMTAKEGSSSVTAGGVTGTAKTPEAKESSLANNSIMAFRLGWRF